MKKLMIEEIDATELKTGDRVLCMGRVRHDKDASDKFKFDMRPCRLVFVDDESPGTTIPVEWL